MSRGPNPSVICLLSDLPDLDMGHKVRFLGCVLAYSTATGCLELGQLHPHGSQVTALVDIRLALELISPELTRIGEWVNVLGYLTANQTVSGQKSEGKTATGGKTVKVQALRVWSTGPLDLKRYESEVPPARGA